MNAAAQLIERQIGTDCATIRRDCETKQKILVLFQDVALNLLKQLPEAIQDQVKVFSGDMVASSGPYLDMRWSKDDLDFYIGLHEGRINIWITDTEQSSALEVNAESCSKSPDFELYGYSFKYDLDETFKIPTAIKDWVVKNFSI